MQRRALVLLSLPLAACVSPVRSPPLVISEREALQWRSFVDDKLRGQIGIAAIKGADPEAVGMLQKSLDWVWRSRAGDKPLADALEDQLRLLRLLAHAGTTPRYQLEAELLSLDGAPYPLGSEGAAEVRYRLRQSDEGGRLVYERRIRSQGDVGWISGLGPARVRAAKESALARNLAMLGRDLVALRP